MTKPFSPDAEVRSNCEMPGCFKIPEVYGSKWCAACWYPGIDDDHQRFLDLKEDGYTTFQAMVMVGWKDPE